MKLKWPFPKAEYIQTTNALQRLADNLLHEPLVAVDTESNSLYAYREQVCLIQISTREADYIIDPLAVKNVQPLAAVMAEPSIEKVFHAAEYDLMCLKRDYGFTFRNLFDTMVAARICGYRSVGLASLLGEFAGVQPDKKHQRDDWGKRPLPQDSLLYAQMDTHYLPMLRDRLAEELTSTNRWREARESFAELCDVQPVANGFDPEGYWRIGLPNQLTRRQIAVLRELYLLREQLAGERDLPPFKIFTDKTLVALAQYTPQSVTDLLGIEGMSNGQIRRYGRQLIEAISAGERAPLPTPPSREPPADPEVVERYTALREWRKNRAQARGVESDVIISKDALWILAREIPRSLEEMRSIPGLGPWRLEAYGQELLALLEQLSAK